MTENTPDAVKVARDAIAAYWAGRGDNDLAALARSGEPHSHDFCVECAILGARAMQAAMPAPDPSGWIVGNADGDQWRRWDETGIPIWTRDRNEATRYARRKDAEDVHREDEDVWRVVPFAIEDAGAREGAQNPVAVMAAALQAVEDEGVFVPDPMAQETVTIFGVDLSSKPDVMVETEWRNYGRSDAEIVSIKATPTPAAAGADVEPVAGLPPIEVDPDMPSREYIPLPGGWEVQTKGTGSSYRLLDRKTGERHLILCNDAKFIHDFVTRMAKEVHAASSPPTTDAIRAQARREAREEAAKVAILWGDKAAHEAKAESKRVAGLKAAIFLKTAAGQIAERIRALAGKPGEAE